MPNFKVRMPWPEGSSVQFYKYRQKLQSQKARPSQSVTLSALINYVHPLDGYAPRPEVLSERVRSSIRAPVPPPIRLPDTLSLPLPPSMLSPLGRPGVLRDGLPDRPLHPGGGQARVAGSNLRVFLMDGRHVKTGKEPVSGGHAFSLSCGGPFPASS